MNPKVVLFILLFPVFAGMSGRGEKSDIKVGKVSAYVVVVSETYCNPCIPVLDSVLPLKTGTLKKYEIIYATANNNESGIQDFIYSFSNKFRHIRFSNFHVVPDTALVRFIHKGETVFSFVPDEYKRTPCAVIINKKTGSAEMLFP